MLENETPQTNETPETNELHEKELKASIFINDSLEKAAKWAKFLAIMGFIGVGLMVIGSIVMMNFGPMADYGFPKVFVSIIYIISAGISFIPLYYLFKFSSNTLKAVKSNNQINLEEGLAGLGSYFKFNGVMIIIVLAFYLIILLFGLSFLPLTGMFN